MNQSDMEQAIQRPQYCRFYSISARLREVIVAPWLAGLVAFSLSYAALLGVKAFAPAVIAPEPSWYFRLAFLVFLFLVAAVCYDPIRRLLTGSMESRLRPSLARRYGADLSEAAYVGVAPYKDFGQMDWDVGFLVVAPDAIRFYGERMSVQLMPGHVSEIKYRSSWVTFSYPQIRIVWKESSPSEYYTVTLRLRGASSGRRTRDLYGRVRGWYDTARVPDSIAILPYAIDQDLPPLGQPIRRSVGFISVLVGVTGTCAMAVCLAATVYLYARTMRILVGPLDEGIFFVVVPVWALSTLRVVLQAYSAGKTPARP